jgi:hypothetical protein
MPSRTPKRAKEAQMAGADRGAQDPLRCPAVPLEAAAAADAVEDEVSEDDEQGRLDQLPDHEKDVDTSEGGGMTGTGVMAEQRGSSEEDEPAEK